METKLYGVSSGDGNNGVSHIFADYYVRTNDPWRLAQLAMVSQFKPAAQKWALDEMEVDGEAEYTISAMILNPPPDSDEDECAEGESYSDANGAWLIVEVFPDDEPREGRPMYDSIDECFDAAELAMVPSENVDA